MLIIFVFLIGLIHANNLTSSASNVQCPEGSVKSQTNHCISLDFLQNSSKPLCTKGFGLINAGGCMGQCNM